MAEGEAELGSGGERGHVNPRKRRGGEGHGWGRGALTLLRQ